MRRRQLPGLSGLAKGLATGKTSSEALVEACIANAKDSDGEGERVFTRLNEDSAKAAARAYDTLRAAGQSVYPFAGIPISVKDLFDVAGEITSAGTKVFADDAPATHDAPVMRRLRQSGFIFIGRTNMTELAYSGLGMNPHYGTPLNPHDRDSRRIPGGSSSGAAVSVTDQMAMAGIGTDTGGSCRIPAALCGLVGFKPTASSIGMKGIKPLSKTLDSVGSLAVDVASVSALHMIMSGQRRPDREPIDLKGLRLGLPQAVVLDDLDRQVAQDFDRALRIVSKAGARVIETPMSCWNAIAEMNALGGFAAAEAFAAYRSELLHHETDFDPRVAHRIQRGTEQTAADYIDLMQARSELIHQFHRAASDFDAVLFPTVPTVAPLLGPLEEDDILYGSTNLLMLRNSSTINMCDGCSVSIPMQTPDALPTGLTLAALNGKDGSLLAIAESVEGLVSVPFGTMH